MRSMTLIQTVNTVQRSLANTVNRRLLNVEEVAQMLDMRTSTIYKWVSQRRIPFVKCGRLTKFDLQRIDEWIKKSSVEEKKFY